MRRPFGGARVAFCGRSDVGGGRTRGRTNYNFYYSMEIFHRLILYAVTVSAVHGRTASVIRYHL